MHYIVSLTLVVAASLGAMQTSVRAAFQKDQATRQQTNGESPDLIEADRLSVQVVELFKAGKIDEAIPVAKRVLKLREKSLGPHHRLVGDATSNLALVYLAAEKYGDAEGMLKRTLGIYEKEPDKNALAIAKTAESLANLHTLKREYPQAEKLYLRAIDLKEKTVGVKDPEFLESLKNLAALFLKQRDYKQAEPALQRVATTTASQLGETTRAFGQALEKLACAQYKNNQTARAEQTEARANHILYLEAARKSEPVALENEAYQCRMTTQVRPDFTQAARAGRFRGSTTIIIEVQADESGSVTSARMVGGDPIFKQAAEKAALATKLRPMIVDGKPVKISSTIFHDYAVTVQTRTVLVPVSRP